MLAVIGSGVYSVTVEPMKQACHCSQRCQYRYPGKAATLLRNAWSAVVSRFKWVRNSGSPLSNRSAWKPCGG